MVLKDVYTEEHERSQDKRVASIAPPTDRLLAGFLDILFHSPIFTLLSSIVLYRLNVLKITVSATSEKMAVFAQLVWIALIGTVILQGVYFKLWKKTPGMRLMKLELRSTTGAELTWGRCLVRSAVWCFEIMMLGIPLLEIFSHQRRHAMHDRVSETEITTLKVRHAGSPFPAEKATVNLVFMTVLMLLLGWVTAFFSTTNQKMQDGTLAMVEWRDKNLLCDQVDDVGSYSNVDLSNLTKRLDFSVSLFLLEQLDEECFQKEVDFAVLKDVDGPLVWVGRALLSGAHTSEREEYFKKACELGDQWCQRALFKEKSTVVEAKQILEKAQIKKPDSGGIAYQTGMLILLNRLGASAQAQTMIENLQSQGIRATGLVAEHLRSLQRSTPDKLPAVLDTLKSVMVEKDFLRINSEICLHQLESGCGGKVRECDVLVSMIPSYKESLDDLVVSRALFKNSLCKNNLIENMEYWTFIESEGLQKLLRIAFQLEKEVTKAQGLLKLRNFIQDESHKVELRLDALQLLISRSNYEEDWKLAPYLWKRLDWTQESFLSASEWFIRQGGKEGNGESLFAFADLFSAIPGLKLNMSLLKEKEGARLPASSEELEK